MTTFLLIISAICLILPAQISQFDQIVNGGYSLIYSSSAYKLIMTIAKYLSIFPTFSFIYEIGYGDLAWYFKMLIWIIFYFIIKIFGTWLFNLIFGLGKGGGITSIIVLIIGIITFIVALV